MVIISKFNTHGYAYDYSKIKYFLHDFVKQKTRNIALLSIYGYSQG
jgi:predicted esterase